MNTPGSIQTYTGVFVNPFDPDPETIRIEDIAHALSQQCRFSGHTKQAWSVAQHSLVVCGMVPKEDKLWALLHDATEAYLVDLPRPIKHRPEFDIYREIESRLEAAIAEKFGLQGPIPANVKLADNVCLWAEADILMHGTEEWFDSDFVGGRPTEIREGIDKAKRVIRDMLGSDTKYVERAFLFVYNELRLSQAATSPLSPSLDHAPHTLASA